MDIIEMLQNRRSVRQYTDEAVPEEKLEKVIHFAERTRFMENEQVRSEVLVTLKLIKREWQDTLED